MTWFAKYLEEKQRLLGMKTQAEFADYLGTTAPNLNRWLKGAMPKPDLQEEIMKKLGGSVLLFNDHPQPPPIAEIMVFRIGKDGSKIEETNDLVPDIHGLSYPSDSAVIDGSTIRYFRSVHPPERHKPQPLEIAIVRDGIGGPFRIVKLSRTDDLGLFHPLRSGVMLTRPWNEIKYIAVQFAVLEV